ncbi:MerR family transcriptional regulator [Niallia alba]|uniref:MerR family transcriptional regulator n=1 Tax=Niallia alba TaxID=2729105 RepID=A0A7Y0KDH3_9BACI|nr:MerR family transcriptional regulator [Niallia alba]NMO80143.1 MerR family transcriptional regulator [Niallia alba]
MKNANSFGYFSKDVAADLEITTSSLRRWSIELEQHGYIMERNEKGQRIYYERDFKALRELKKLLANNVSFTDALNAVVSMNMDEKNATKTPSVFTDEIRLSKSELEETIQRVVKVAIEEERENMLKAFEYKMNDVVEKRDRILTMQLQQSLEEKRLEIAAAKEEEEVKPWWKKLFK